MNRLKFFVIAMLVGSPAFGQQPMPDPAFMQRALSSIQAQRNQALDSAASQAARADGLAEELAKAQARIKEMEDKEAKK